MANGVGARSVLVRGPEWVPWWGSMEVVVVEEGLRSSGGKDRHVAEASSLPLKIVSQLGHGNGEESENWPPFILQCSGLFASVRMLT